jgi:hypothetical protein
MSGLGVLSAKDESMPEKVTALFKDQAQAESALTALRWADFDSVRTETGGPGEAHLPDFGGDAARGIGTGSIGGSVVGAIVGVLASGLIPGTQAFVQGGVLVPLMYALALGATGGLAGLLFSASALRERKLYHEQEHQSGPYLVSVDAEAERLESASGRIASGFRRSPARARRGHPRGST